MWFSPSVLFCVVLDQQILTIGFICALGGVYPRLSGNLLQQKCPLVHFQMSHFFWIHVSHNNAGLINWSIQPWRSSSDFRKSYDESSPCHVFFYVCRSFRSPNNNQSPCLSQFCRAQEWCKDEKCLGSSGEPGWVVTCFGHQFCDRRYISRKCVNVLMGIYEGLMMINDD